MSVLVTTFIPEFAMSSKITVTVGDIRPGHTYLSRSGEDDIVVLDYIGVFPARYDGACLVANLKTGKLSWVAGSTELGQVENGRLRVI